MQPAQSILDLEIEDWRSSTAAVQSTAQTVSYFDEVSYGNGSQHRESPLDSPPMISMSSPYISSPSYPKQQQYGTSQSQIHVGALHHPHNAHNQHQHHYETIPIHQQSHNGSQHQYDMDIDSVYHNSYTNAQGQQQIHSPPFSPGSQHHIQQRLDQHQSEPTAVCDPRYVTGHHDFHVQHQTKHSVRPTSSGSSSPSSPSGFKGHVEGRNPSVKLEGDTSNDSFSPRPPQSLAVVIPSNTTYEDIRLSATKRKSSSASETSQHELFDPGYSLVTAVRVELDGANDGVVSPTALISPLERAELEHLPSQDGEPDHEGYSDADGESEEYDYDDPNDSEFVPHSRSSLPRRTSHHHLSSTQHQAPHQGWLDIPAGRRRAATSPNVAVPQTYQPQPSYAWGYSHDGMGSPSNAGYNSNAGGVVRSRSGTTSTADHSHRYNPYPTAGYTYDAPQSITHSSSYDSTASSASFADELTYPTQQQPTYPSLELNLHSLRSRRASTSTTTSTTTPNTPLTPLTPLSTGGGDGQVGVHVHGYSTRSGGVSHSYSNNPASSMYDGSSSGMLNGASGHMSLHGDLNGMGGSSKRRSRPSTSLPVPVPVPNLTKKSRGRRVPTVYSSSSSSNNTSGASAFPSSSARDNLTDVDGFLRPEDKGARIHMCKVPGCGKCFARGEHLKRHVRSIHTWEKPHKCPYPGCGKDFSRHDNLGQHMRVHKDYNPRT
ncbi:hypothetical protein V5O48_006183 [Marasmius crinis-equi]|uniref:C2H2-type domain-containing protein n=1 Tax=Marasmius crinis-equi TaxID=585013 RepID=A0ABR3FKT3_9AGAR